MFRTVNAGNTAGRSKSIIISWSIWQFSFLTWAQHKTYFVRKWLQFINKTSYGPRGTRRASLAYLYFSNKEIIHTRYFDSHGHDVKNDFPAVEIISANYSLANNTYELVWDIMKLTIT